MMTTTKAAEMETEVARDCVFPRMASAVLVLAFAWPALLLATVCLAPYLRRPFNIDGRVRLLILVCAHVRH